MAGDEGNGTPKDFNECVSQDQLNESIENGQKVMTETITQAVTAAIRDLKLPETIERVDRRISNLTDWVVVSETHPPPMEEEDVVYNAHGHVDQAATREARLQHRLRTNTTDMGCTHNRAPEDPYAKVKFTIPSFFRHYDAEGYLD
ncbi:hypothetical protein PVAP13_2KG282716 [Panicum virgatum]|uniref:Uncharacterized protein n=1 Tax=Panicum virgatum TaxID=38727 RepID=A0A8T0W1N4_PANVG|nr:hypothetical protein PVAP13_2KG282716 [Panicum virgatum]